MTSEELRAERDRLHMHRTAITYETMGRVIASVFGEKTRLLSQGEWNALRSAVREYDSTDKALQTCLNQLYKSTCEATVVRHCEDTGDFCGKPCADDSFLCAEHKED